MKKDNLSKSQMRRIAIQEGKPMPTFEGKVEGFNECDHVIGTWVDKTSPVGCLILTKYLFELAFIKKRIKDSKCWMFKHCPDCGVKLDDK